MFDRLIDGLDAVSRRLVWFGGALLILSAVVVTVDVFARKLFNISLAGADELSGYAFGIATMLALAHALIHKSNIRVDAFYHRFPTGVRAAADLLGLILLVGFLGFVAYYGFNLLAESYAHSSRSITPLRTPLAVPQTLWCAGIAFCLFTGIVLLAAALGALMRRDWQAVERRIGVKTVDEQIEEETE